MIEVEILFFAHAKDLAGSACARLTLPAGATVATAATELAGRFPRLGGLLKTCRFAVNEEFARGGDAIPDRAMIAVLPPVSGG